MSVDIVMHDRDTKFTAAFDDALKQADLRVHKTPYRSPNTVAFVERFIQTLGQECLDHFIIFGERHLNHLCGVFIDYYHRLRPHQAKENDLLTAEEPRRKPRKKLRAPLPDVLPLSEIRCEQRLGGLLKHYYRRAA